MPFRLQTIALISYAEDACVCAAGAHRGGIIVESPSQYRPRRPEGSAFYQLFETHFDSYVRAYEERFEAQSAPLRPVVVRSVEEFLSCGRLQGGFARIRCPKCRKEHLLTYSCRTRNFCSSCQAKRSRLFAEKLAAEILAPLPHRHWTFSIPRVLRRLFERETSLLGLLSQTAYASILKTVQARRIPSCAAAGRACASSPRVADRILRHLGSGCCRAQDPFEPRVPPAAAATIRQ